MKGPGIHITGGELRGRVVAAPAEARPTEGRVREALFSIWNDRLAGSRVLDLFAGSGVVAFEAVGRGALEALCVESSPAALKILRTNSRSMDLTGVVTVRRGSLPDTLGSLAEAAAGRFDLIFADPPYRFRDHKELLEAAAGVLASEGEMAIEHSSRVETPLEAAGLVRTDRRRYGETALSFYRRGS